MGPRSTEIDDSTPEDVAALYAWAGLTGARYRDFSAERREQRAQMRYQAAKQFLQTDLETEAQGGAESLEVAGPRVESARRSEAAARAALQAIEEEQEIAEARESAQRKQQAFEQGEQRRRERTGPQPGELISGRSGDAASPEGERADAIEFAEAEGARLNEAAGRPAAIRPAWLEPGVGAEVAEGAAATVLPRPSASARSHVSGATLLDSRERVAERWPMLREVIADALPATSVRVSRRRGPVVAVVSPVGGAGKTSLAAALARAMAREGERVLLVETGRDGLLPLQFGMSELRAGEVREVAAREERGAVSIAALDIPAARAERRAQEEAIEQLLAMAQGCDRVVLDLAPDSSWMVRGLAALKPMVLAAIAPEMNSVAGLRTLEQVFAEIVDGDGRSLLPFYVLNRFDAALPLHLDIREVLRRRLGERLLPVTVRRSAAVGEAMAEGMTALDYAPHAPVARDYGDVASWLRGAAPASSEAIADAARGER